MKNITNDCYKYKWKCFYINILSISKLLVKAGASTTAYYLGEEKADSLSHTGTEINS